LSKKSKIYYDDLDDDLDDQLSNFNYEKKNDEKNEENEDDNEEDKISLEKEEKIIKILDDDLLKYFGDAKIITKRKSNNNFKKNKKKDFTIGQKIKINDLHGKILFGPYEINGKLMCEIELENGNIISEDVNNFK